MTRAANGRITGPFARAVLTASGILAAIAVAVAAGTGASATDWIQTASAIVFLGAGVLGLLLVQQGPRNAAGWLLLAASAGMSMLAVIDLVSPHAVGAPAAVIVLLILRTIAGGTLFALFTLGILLLPDGRPPGRFGRILAILMMVALGLLLAGSVAHPEWNISGAAPLVSGLLGAVTEGFVLVGFALLVPLTVLAAVAVGLRRRRAVGDTRRALVLVEWAAWLNAVTTVVCGTIASIGALPEWFGAVADQSGVILAIAAWIGIVRFRLIDLRLTISRTLPTIAISAVVIAVSALVATFLGSIVSAWAAAAIAAAIAALIALPLRDRLQALANLLIYGRRADPETTFALLSARLRDGVDTGAALEQALATIRETLGVEAWVGEEGGSQQTGSRTATSTAHRIPLAFAGRPVGTLSLSGRLRPGDRRLLRSLAPQIAAAVHARRLEAALRESNRLAIAARDDERRRIRRDLHDGLGPTLAGMVLGVESAERHLAEPARARADLARLHESSQGAVHEVRRIVYALRPPILDSLGLEGAIREQAERLGAASVDLDAIPALPETFEIGVYLIALEAMKNAATHARPGAFRVRLAAGERLEFAVQDDGPGLPPRYTPGIGIRSMRDRAAELGGTLHLTAREPHGTLVFADLPLRG